MSLLLLDSEFAFVFEAAPASRRGEPRKAILDFFLRSVHPHKESTR